MSATADTTNNESVLTQQKKGNHKGCPYDELAVDYFQRKPLWTPTDSNTQCRASSN